MTRVALSGIAVGEATGGAVGDGEADGIGDAAIGAVGEATATGVGDATACTVGEGTCVGEGWGNGVAVGTEGDDPPATTAGSRVTTVGEGRAVGVDAPGTHAVTASAMPAQRSAARRDSRGQRSEWRSRTSITSSGNRNRRAPGKSVGRRLWRAGE